ncbi:MAG: cytidyltransferase, partial [Nanoarchaeota archaeon]
VDEVYLDTESDEVFSLATGRNHFELRRLAELASNKTNGNQLLLHEASRVPDADIYVQALPTAPFLSRKTIEKAIYELVRSRTNDSLFGVSKQRLYLWNSDDKPINYDPSNIPNSFDLKDTTIETMSLYLIRKEALLRTQSRIGVNPILFNIPLLESIDINTEEDFDFAKIIHNGLRGEK